MSSLQTLSLPESVQLICDAAARQFRLVLTVPRADGWCTLKALLEEERHGDGHFIVRLLPQHSTAYRECRPGDVVGITFRNGRKKCMFSSELLSVSQFAGNERWKLAWPDDIRQLQRRAYERAEPPRGKVVPVKFWQCSGQSDGGDLSQARHGQLVDISAGGMRVKTGDLNGIEEDRDYRCVLAVKHPGPTLVIDARLRHRESAQDGRASLGFQFIGLETSEEGRKTLARLARLVAQYQRNNQSRRIRRHKSTRPN